MQRHCQKDVSSFCQVRNHPHWCQHAVVAALLTRARNLLACDIRLIFLRAFPSAPLCLTMPKSLWAQNLQGTFLTQDSGKVFLQGIQDKDKGMKREKKPKSDRNYYRNAYWLILIIFNDLTFFNIKMLYVHFPSAPYKPKSTTFCLSF